jgi:hypothetical protein
VAKDPKDPSYDPLYRQLTVRLESLPANSKSFAVTQADSGEYLLWYYDPKNRIMSPGVAVFKDLAELASDLVASMLGDHDDDPEIKKTLERALEWAKLSKLEYHAKVHEKGGYTVKDPELLSHDRPWRNKERAAELREQARALRKKLEGQHA